MESPKSSALELLSDPLTHRGVAFSEEQQSELGLRGLLPPGIGHLDMHVARPYAAFSTRTMLSGRGDKLVATNLRRMLR